MNILLLSYSLMITYIEFLGAGMPYKYVFQI